MIQFRKTKTIIFNFLKQKEFTCKTSLKTEIRLKLTAHVKVLLAESISMSFEARNVIYNERLGGILLSSANR